MIFELLSKSRLKANPNHDACTVTLRGSPFLVLFDWYSLGAHWLRVSERERLHRWGTRREREKILHSKGGFNDCWIGGEAAWSDVRGAGDITAAMYRWGLIVVVFVVVLYASKLLLLLLYPQDDVDIMCLL